MRYNVYLVERLLVKAEEEFSVFIMDQNGNFSYYRTFFPRSQVRAQVHENIIVRKRSRRDIQGLRDTGKSGRSEKSGKRTLWFPQDVSLSRTLCELLLLYLLSVLSFVLIVSLLGLS